MRKDPKPSKLRRRRSPRIGSDKDQNRLIRDYRRAQRARRNRKRGMRMNRK